MPRSQAEKEEGYPITYAVLGLLAEWGPMSGYDLKRWFDRGLGTIWSAAHSQIYTELLRLTRFGWATMTREEQEQRPDRKVYTVTNEGLAALAEWHCRPSAPLQIRDEILLKIVLGRFAPPGALATNLRLMLAYHEEQLAQMQEEVREHIERARAATEKSKNGEIRTADWYIALPARLGVAYEETYIQWLRDAIALIENDGPDATSEKT